MLVKNWMSKNVITADINDSMQDAMKHLKEHDIRMLIERGFSGQIFLINPNHKK
jgi:predicted transcriptional regulator